MTINYQKYYDTYHQEDGKFVDILQSSDGLKIVPFVSNTQCAYDKKCGLLGITGEFFRKWKKTETKPINNFKDDVETPVSSYLSEHKNMHYKQIQNFIKMLEDILYVNGNLNITDSAFLKYLPLMPDDEKLTKTQIKKYLGGEERFADYLYSMVCDYDIKIENKISPNIFTTILKEALEYGNILREFKDIDGSGQYYSIPYVKESFKDDLVWLLSQEEAIIVKNIPLLLHFYACYSVTQTIACMSPRKTEYLNKPEPLYFILATEKASLNCEAVTHGWMQKIPDATLNSLYGKIQTLDIINCCLGGNIGLYPELLKSLKGTPFEDNKALCEKVLENYQNDKRKLLQGRPSESNRGGEPIDTVVNSYEDFFEKLNHLCIDLQSASYKTRMKRQVIDLMNIRFLQLRRGNYVLVLDNEMLIFLMAMVTKGRKTKLENMYKYFNDYGIHFNISTRNSIEDLLLKLNLLDRKSDSGEAQYVTVVL